MRDKNPPPIALHPTASRKKRKAYLVHTIRLVDNRQPHLLDRGPVRQKVPSLAASRLITASEPDKCP